MSTYSPTTKKDIELMLNKLNLKKIDQLFDIISDEFKYDLNSINLEDNGTEFDVSNKMSDIANKNLNTENALCFMGGGAYDHYIPKIIDTLSSRSEFYTAYTPYQPEVSQGTLQYLYEFQTMICELSGMEISNASLYDGASSVAEACSMSISYTNNKTILLSSALHPSYKNLVEIYFKHRDVNIIEINSNDGITSIQSIKDNMNDDIACIVIQSPNYNGLLEDWSEISKYKDKSLLIGVSDPISLSIIKTPGDSNCDIYVGEGQSLGNYLSFGGPYIGLFASKLKYARKMPGRIIGRTKDVDEKEGFVMTLQTREQHIRRERATSNICTNQGLLALRSTIYMSIMGKYGIADVANMSFQNAHYAADQIEKLENYKLKFNNRNFVKEFVIETKMSAKKIQSELLKDNIMVDLVQNSNEDNQILVAFTEKRTKNQIDKLIDSLKNIT